jgi:hypothetical protein
MEQKTVALAKEEVNYSRLKDILDKHFQQGWLYDSKIEGRNGGIVLVFKRKA